MAMVAAVDKIYKLEDFPECNRAKDGTCLICSYISKLSDVYSKTENLTGQGFICTDPVYYEGNYWFLAVKKF